MFDVRGFVGRRRSVIVYARVSRPVQKHDLETQVARLRLDYPQAEVVKDIGSGLNFKRKGLRSILERVLRGESLVVVVTYRDRLARFGFDLIEHLVTGNGGQVVVLNQIDTSPQQELVGDLTAILTVFSSRLHGLRSHKNKKALVASYQGAEGNPEDLDGGVPPGV